MKLDVRTLEAKKAGSIDLDDAVFGVPLEEIRRDLLHRVVRWQLAKRRSGSHKTQERGEVSRTGAKYGRQKGGG
ncbi:MAG: 50S ribosomal protein L4, partial [Caulobacterales bacterium]|nr:50S ribosomal protein L4 [Caulobacterales bacterium]